MRLTLAPLCASVFFCVFFFCSSLQLKSILTLFIVHLFGYPFDISLRTGLGLAQVGEFAFVLSSSGVSYGLINTEQYNFLAAVTTVSLVVTPLLHFISRKLVGDATAAAAHVHVPGSGSGNGTAAQMEGNARTQAAHVSQA